MDNRSSSEHRDNFDLAKQIRIAERNKRHAMRLGDERLLREALPAWLILLGLAAIFAGTVLAAKMIWVFR